MRYVAAASCGLSFVALSAYVTNLAQVVGDIYFFPIETDAVTDWMIVGLRILYTCLVFVLGFACGRFILRAYPIRVWHQPRHVPRRVVVPLLLYLAVLGSYVGLLAAQTFGSSHLRPEPRVIDWTLSIAVFVLLWATSTFGSVIYRRRQARAFLERPFVLFLRRFSTFSDRAVTALILGQASPDVPVVFLVPHISRIRDWDPYLVGFAGLKLIHPWRSIPLVVSADDDQWQSAANELIEKARTILLDTTRGSEAFKQRLKWSGRRTDGRTRYV